MKPTKWFPTVWVFDWGVGNNGGRLDPKTRALLRLLLHYSGRLLHQGQSAAAGLGISRKDGFPVEPLPFPGAFDVSATSWKSEARTFEACTEACLIKFIKTPTWIGTNSTTVLTYHLAT